jgi:hypothetical protein
MTEAEREAWERDGFFIRRGLVSKRAIEDIERELITVIRANPPSAHRGAAFYNTGEYAITTETVPTSTVRHAEDEVSKVFNAHALGATRALGESEALAAPVCDLIGAEIDCFQSQFILASRRIVSSAPRPYYFTSTVSRSRGLVAPRATLKNGRLWGCRPAQRTNYKHIPDCRSAANKGYLRSWMRISPAGSR